MEFKHNNTDQHGSFEVFIEEFCDLLIFQQVESFRIFIPHAEIHNH